MTTQPQQPNPIQNNYYPDDEIELIDYLRVLWKWNWLIIAGTLICAVAAAAISLRMPEIYEITTVIEPGVIAIDHNGKFIYIDSAVNISGKINEGSYNRKIEKVLSPNLLKAGVDFKSTIAKETNIINITSKWKEENADFGLKAAGELIRLLAGDYERIIGHRKAVFDRQIFSKQNNIKKFETQAELLKKALKDIKRRMEELKKETDNIKNNTADPIKQKNLLLKESKAKAEMPFLFYSTSIQQNISYWNQMNNQIYEFKEKENEVLREIVEAERSIDTAKTEIAMLNINKDLISNIKVIQEPEVLLHPVKPKKKQIVLLAGVVGLFFFVFLAFFIEYIKNASKSSPANKRT